MVAMVVTNKTLNNSLHLNDNIGNNDQHHADADDHVDDGQDGDDEDLQPQCAPLDDNVLERPVIWEGQAITVIRN